MSETLENLAFDFPRVESEATADMHTSSDFGTGAVLDVETTGFRNSDRIVELAICLFSYEKRTGRVAAIVDEYVGLQDPGIPIPPEAMAVHGIRNEDVCGQELDLDRVLDILGRAEFVIAHNAEFDRRFITAQFPMLKNLTWLCSCWQIPWHEKGFSTRKLQYLLEQHRIHVNRKHRALDDVRATLQLLAKGRGETTYLAELLRNLRDEAVG